MAVKAIIPAAGIGTRLFPLTYAIPKEFLPLGPIPLIHYLFLELIKSGVEVVVVVMRDSTLSPLQYFSPNPGLDERARGSDLEKLLEPLWKVRQSLEVITVFQRAPLGLGDAIRAARRVIGDDPFYVALPDEIILQEPPVLLSLRANSEGSQGSVAVMEVEPEEVSRYGIVDVKGSPLPALIHDLVEKPSLAEAPSRWAIVGRYYFPPRFMRALEELPLGKNNEYQLTDAMRLHLKEFPLLAVPLQGMRLDTGNREGYFHAWRLFLEEPQLFARYLELPFQEPSLPKQP